MCGGIMKKTTLTLLLKVTWHTDVINYFCLAHLLVKLRQLLAQPLHLLTPLILQHRGNHKWCHRKKIQEFSSNDDSLASKLVETVLKETLRKTALQRTYEYFFVIKWAMKKNILKRNLHKTRIVSQENYRKLFQSGLGHSRKRTELFTGAELEKQGCG